MTGRRPDRSRRAADLSRSTILAFAQGWAGHARTEMEKMQIQTDPHPLNRFRVNGTLSNMPEFFEAFGIKEGKMMPKSGAGCRLW